MNAAHLHLAMNHIPVVGALLVILLLGISLARRNEVLKKTGLSGLVLIALLSVPAYLTGEPAEHFVEKLAGIAKETVERHEEASQIAFTVLIAAGVFSLVGLLLFRKRAVPQWFGICVLAVAFGSTILMSWAANLGGKIRHPEIVSQSSVQSPSSEHEEHH